ncbi:acyl--CoA ligase [Nonomuraea sp. NN258]|uniref:class I adenylate-forming enzyme family protein n=1 Tax=Nonomuraea antri TaxID=2730852 RepID=UPI00156938FF|nr:class I adenylate-forming enzyme family protein [Nonomuraea antri]NRQ31651.1 acyl--CoA ligase [Nonomuraea antri]
MTYAEMPAAELLSAGFEAADVAEHPWVVRWDAVGDVEDLVLSHLPDTVDLRTSGTTGQPTTWRRTREQLWREAHLLAGLLRPDAPRALVTFAPPRHLYGALAGVLVPAILGVPAWHRPRYFGAMPDERGGAWAVTALPWTFSILGRHREWVAAAERITILHSTAMLPPSAAETLGEMGAGRARLVEVFGSTEAGGIARREGDGPWELLPDVTFAGPVTPGEYEVSLEIRSPRIATRPGEPPRESWRTDDFVRPLDERRFVFAGRRGRLAKVNGRRVPLDELEHAALAVLDCADLAIQPVSAELSGEALTLLVVAHPGSGLTEAGVRAAVSRLGLGSCGIRLVGHIDRTETGKLRRVGG